MCRRSASEENPGPQQPGLRGVTRASAHGHSCVSCLLFGHKQWHWARPGTHSPQQLGGKGPGVSKGSQGQLKLRVDSCPGALGRQGQIKVRRLQPDVQPRSCCSLGLQRACGRPGPRSESSTKSLSGPETRGPPREQGADRHLELQQTGRVYSRRSRRGAGSREALGVWTKSLPSSWV